MQHYSRCHYEMRCGKSSVMAAASNTITAAVATIAWLSPDRALPVCRPAPHTPLAKSAVCPEVLQGHVWTSMPSCCTDTHGDAVPCNLSGCFIKQHCLVLMSDDIYSVEGQGGAGTAGQGKAEWTVHRIA